MSKRLHPKRRARMVKRTAFFFPNWKEEDMIFKKIGKYWVVRREGDRFGHKPAQMVRLGYGQLNRRWEG